MRWGSRLQNGLDRTAKVAAVEVFDGRSAAGGSMTILDALDGQDSGRLLQASDGRSATPRSRFWTLSARKGNATAPYNQLFAALSSSDFHRLGLDFQLVRLRAGDVLAEPGDPVHDIWFPETCIVALTVHMEEGSTAEVGILGFDGVVGYPVIFGDRRALARAVVQVAGDALRVPAKPLLAAFEASSGFRRVVLRHIGALHAETLQSAACHALHPAELRLARLLLMFQERGSGGAAVPLTHELLAGMLGVQRTTVTAAAGALQRGKLIAYRHGMIEILDRAGLEKAACECYRVIRSHCEHLLPSPAANGAGVEMLWRRR
jgi:CRP-like cAMP-binding protein